MALIKVLLLCFLLVIVECRRHHSPDLEDELQDIIQRYEKYAENKRDETKSIDDDVNDVFVPASPNPNLNHCYGAGLDCEHCSACFTGGWCVKNPGSKPKCLCNYGWTGPNAEYVEDTSDPEWGKNRIRADHCLEPCHYTHHVRNKTCAADPFNSPPGCHTLCGQYQGKCDTATGRCVCCRGWAGPNKQYLADKDRYTADYCDQECPYLGFQKENPTCRADSPMDSPPECNSLCEKSDGKCVEGGMCLCCLGWTGPFATFGTGKYGGRILASYCDVYCPYTLEKQSAMCVNPDYVQRRREAGHKISVSK